MRIKEEERAKEEYIKAWKERRVAKQKKEKG